MLHELRHQSLQWIRQYLSNQDSAQTQTIAIPQLLLKGGKKAVKGSTQASGTTATKTSSGTTKATIAMVQDEPEKRPFNSNLKCFNCNGKGHFARDCEKPKKPQGGRGGKRSQPPHRGGGRDQSQGQPQVQAVDSTPAEETVRSVRHERETEEREGGKGMCLCVTQRSLIHTHARTHNHFGGYGETHGPRQIVDYCGCGCVCGCVCGCGSFVFSASSRARATDRT